MFLKVCGITRLVDARHAVEHGATALGFVLWPRSPRFVSNRKVAEIVANLPSSVVTVGVFVNQSVDGIVLTMRETGLTAVQLHGDEPADYASALSWPILRSVTVDTARQIDKAWPSQTTLLMDAADQERRGGTGRPADWIQAADWARHRRLVLAGGLTPENVAEAVAVVHPYGVDVSSGVEDAPGLKNAKRVSRFLSNAREAMERWQMRARAN